MWILPKQLHTSAYVPDTAALISDLAEQSQICEPSLLARSKPSLARTWSQKWKRDSWTQHLSGRILKPSHGQTFVTAWTSSLEVIPASHSQQPGRDLDETTPDISGLGSQMELFPCDPESASSRTSRDTSASDSERSSANWKALVTLRRGEYSQRVKSAVLTNASGCLSWPTASSRDWKDSPGMSQTGINPDGTTRNRMDQLPRAVFGAEYLSRQTARDTTKKPENWETSVRSAESTTAKNVNALDQPRTEWNTLIKTESFTQDPNQQAKHGQAAPVNRSTDGSRQESWATPNTMDYMEPRPVEAMKRMLDHGQRKNRKWSSNVREQVVWDQNYAPAWATPRNMTGGICENGVSHSDLNSQAGGKLNPRWVETLMGLPIGWTMPSCSSPLTIAPTNCDCLETESCLPPQPELF